LPEQVQFVATWPPLLPPELVELELELELEPVEAAHFKSEHTSVKLHTKGFGQ